MERGSHRSAYAVDQPTANKHHNPNAVGCGLFGCLAGLVFGLFAGGILLLFAAVVTALATPMPPLPATPPHTPDLQVTITENFLNIFARQPADGVVSIDILPSDQVALMGQTSWDTLGVQTPLQVTGLFQIHVTPQAVQVVLINTEVSDPDFPPELNNFFAEDTPLINQDLQMMIERVSQTLGVPVIITGLTTNNSQIQIGVREVR